MRRTRRYSWRQTMKKTVLIDGKEVEIDLITAKDLPKETEEEFEDDKDE